MKLKRAIQKAFHNIGFEPRRNAYALQRELISAPQPVVFDVGAHVGVTAAKYRKLFPAASIYCFEPFPQCFKNLRQSVDGDARVFCFPIALSDQIGTAKFNNNLSSGTNSLLPTDPRAGTFWGEGLLNTSAQIDVPTNTLDAFVEEQKIPHIDILKLDVQGAEFAVLTGAKETLARRRISLIYTELIMCPTYQGQHQLHEYLALFDSLGYELVDFFNPVRRKNRLIQSDVIFLNSSFQAS